MLSIFADFLAQERDISLELRFSRTKAMEIYKNGVRRKNASRTHRDCLENRAVLPGGI